MTIGPFSRFDPSKGHSLYGAPEWYLRDLIASSAKGPTNQKWKTATSAEAVGSQIQQALTHEWLQWLWYANLLKRSRLASCGYFSISSLALFQNLNGLRGSEYVSAVCHLLRDLFFLLVGGHSSWAVQHFAFLVWFFLEQFSIIIPLGTF